MILAQIAITTSFIDQIALLHKEHQKDSIIKVDIHRHISVIADIYKIWKYN